jgi:hypothetical protein
VQINVFLYINIYPLKSDTAYLYKYFDREQKERGENDNEKRKWSKIIENERNNENKLEYSKIFIDNGQKISPENVLHIHGTEVATQETVIKGKIDNDFIEAQGQLRAGNRRN